MWRVTLLLTQVEKIASQTALCPSSNLYMCLYHKATVTDNAVASTDDTATSAYNLRHNPVQVIAQWYLSRNNLCNVYNYVNIVYM